MHTRSPFQRYTLGIGTLFICLFLAEFATAQTRASTVDTAKTITLLFTNDVESAYDPIPAFWLDGMSQIGGIDVLFAGHADAGTPRPVVHEKTGTLIMQTYGQATHLGYLQLSLDAQTGKITHYDGKLIPVDPSRWAPDPRVVAKLQQYRDAHPEIMLKVGTTAAHLNSL